eukprot:UN22092
MKILAPTVYRYSSGVSKSVCACERTFSSKILIHFCLVRSSRFAPVLLPFLSQFSVPLSPYTNPGLNGKYPGENKL